MDKQAPNLVQNLKNAFKTNDYYPQKAKGISFFAFLFSIFIYISIFYIFNLSPSNLLHNNKFWFSISNTLILILAADYGYFSSCSSKSPFAKQDIYDEYTMRKLRNIPTPTKYTAFPNQIGTKNYNQEVDFQSKRRLKHLNSLPPLAAYDVEDTLVDSSFCLYKKRREESCALKHHDIKEHFVSYHEKKKKKVSPAFMKRTRSDVAKRVVIDESRNIVRRIESDFEPSDYSDEETDYDDQEESGKNKYANLSNEELNRRVEDFIQQFNMQIRLQEN